MCRNITELRGLEPAATSAEIEAAARQYVRKVSGLTKPTDQTREAFGGRRCRHRGHRPPAQPPSGETPAARNGPAAAAPGGPGPDRRSLWRYLGFVAAQSEPGRPSELALQDGAVLRIRQGSGGCRRSARCSRPRSRSPVVASARASAVGRRVRPSRPSRLRVPPRARGSASHAAERRRSGRSPWRRGRRGARRAPGWPRCRRPASAEGRRRRRRARALGPRRRCPVTARHRSGPRPRC